MSKELEMFRLEDRVLFEAAAAAEIVDAAEAAQDNPNADVSESDKQAQEERDALKNAPPENPADQAAKEPGAPQTAPEQVADVDAQVERLLQGDLPESASGDGMEHILPDNGIAVDDDIRPGDGDFVEVDIRDAGATVSTGKELVVINFSVHDKEQIIGSLVPDQECLVLEYDASADPLETIREYLAEKGEQYDAIHLVTHGDAGYITLNGAVYDSESFEAEPWRAIGEYIRPGGDLMIYSCNLTATGAGHDFVALVADATGADVAASDNSTGLRGDWVLEHEHGQIETANIAVDNYGHDLYSRVITYSTTTAQKYRTVIIDGKAVKIDIFRDSMAGALDDGVSEIIISHGRNQNNDNPEDFNGVSVKNSVFKYGSDVDYDSMDAELFIPRDAGEALYDNISIGGGSRHEYQTFARESGTFSIKSNKNVTIVGEQGSDSILKFTEDMTNLIVANDSSLAFYNITVVSPGTIVENYGTLHLGSGAVIRGAIANFADMTVDGAVIGKGGVVNRGGELAIANATFTGISGSAVTSEDTRYEGNGRTYDKFASILIADSVFGNNSGGAGGAIGSKGVNPIVITGSTFTGNRASGSGGAIYAVGQVSVTDCEFSGNTASKDGGAIAASSAIVRNSTFSSNHASDAGAAIYLDIALYPTGLTAIPGNVIADSTFDQNSGAAHGGAIAFESFVAAKVTNNTFTTNGATQGGAIYYGAQKIVGGTELPNLLQGNRFENNQGTDGCAIMVAATFNLNLNDNLFHYNRTMNGVTGTSNGGAIYANDLNTVFSLKNVTFTNNRADFGGALAIVGNLTLENCFFEGNTAVKAGGAMYISQYAINTTILDTVFSSNRAGTGGAIYSNGSNLTVQRSTFYNNQAIAGHAGALFINLINSNNRILFESCDFYKNTSTEAICAMALIASSRSLASTVSIVNCTIVNNYQQGVKWGMDSFATVFHAENISAFYLVNCDIYNNRTVGYLDTYGSVKCSFSVENCGYSSSGVYIDNTNDKTGAIWFEPDAIWSTTPTGSNQVDCEVTFEGKVIYDLATHTINHVALAGKGVLAGLANGVPVILNDALDGWLTVGGEIFTGTVDRVFFTDRLGNGRMPDSVSVGAMQAESDRIVAWIGSPDFVLGNQFFRTVDESLNAYRNGDTIYVINGSLAVSSYVFRTNCTIVSKGGTTLVWNGSDTPGLDYLFQVDTQSLTLSGITLSAQGGVALVNRATVNFSGGGISSDYQWIVNYSGGKFNGHDMVFALTGSSGRNMIDNSAGGVVTLNGGSFDGGAAGMAGRLVYNAGTMTLNGLDMRNFSTVTSGGIYNSGELAVLYSVFRNFRSNQGGVIYSTNRLTLDTVQFIDNVATLQGGAVFLAGGSATVAGSTFTGNSGGAGLGNGGGGAIGGVGIASLAVSDSTFANNRSGGHGGAISVSGGSTVMNINTFSGNSSAKNGGAVYADSLEVQNSVFTGNRATGDGGAIYVQNALTVLQGYRHTVFNDNQAGYRGGAIFGNENVSVQNGDFNRNGAFSDGRSDSAGGAIYAVGELATTGSSYSSNLAAYGGAIRAEGKLTALGDWFVGNRTFALGDGADPGLDSVPAGQGGAIYSTHTVELAKANFARNLSREGGAIYGKGGSFRITESVFNDNQAALAGGAIFVTGAKLNIDAGTGFAGNLVTLEKTAAAAADGGAIYAVSSQTAVNNSSFENNGFDVPVTVGQGGAISTLGGTLEIRNSKFYENHAATGGAVYGVGTATLVGESALAYNRTSVTAGGIYLRNQTLTVQNSTVYANLADAGSATGVGGIRVDNGNLALISCTVAANSGGSNLDGTYADGAAGGVYVAGGYAYVLNNIITGNYFYRQLSPDQTIPVMEEGYQMKLRTTSSLVKNSEYQDFGRMFDALIGASKDHEGIWCLVDSNGDDIFKTEAGTLQVGGNSYARGNGCMVGSITGTTDWACYDTATKSWRTINGAADASKVDILYYDQAGNARNPQAVTMGALQAESDTAVCWSGSSDIMNLQANTYYTSIESGVAGITLDGDTLYLMNIEHVLTDTVTIGKNITIRGAGNNTRVVMEADDASLFVVETGTKVIFESFTISASIYNSDGMIVNKGNLTLDGMVFTDNSGKSTVLANQGTLNVSDTLFENNRARRLIDNTGNLTIDGSTFRGNGLADGLSVRPGHIVARENGNVTISGSLFEDNTVDGSDGGVILLTGGKMTIVNTTFSGNSSTAGYGGAVYVSSVDGGTKLEIRNSTFYGNTARYGGGALAAENTVLTIENSTFYDNSVTSGGGGAIYLSDNTQATLVYATVYGNRVGATQFGSEIYAEGSSLGIISSIVCGSDAARNHLFSINTASKINVAYSLVGNAAGNFGNTAGTVFGATAQTVFGAGGFQSEYWGDHGGETFTLKIPEAATASGAGALAGFIVPGEYAYSHDGQWYGLDGSRITGTVNALGWDQRSNDRNPLVVTAGAYQVYSDSYVAWTGSENITAAGNAFFTSVEAAMGSGSEVIYLYGIEISLNTTIDVNRTVTIIGMSGTVLDAGGDKRAFYVGESGDLTLDHVQIRNGYSSGNGGAIYNMSGSLTVKNSSFSHNRSAKSGGAIANDRGSVLVVNSTFYNNSATDQGGAIVNFAGTSFLGLVNSTLTGNHAGTNGGSLSVYSDSAHIANTILVGGTVGAANTANDIYLNNASSLFMEYSVYGEVKVNSGAPAISATNTKSTLAGVFGGNTYDPATGLIAITPDCDATVTGALTATVGHEVWYLDMPHNSDRVWKNFAGGAHRYNPDSDDFGMTGGTVWTEGANGNSRVATLVAFNAGAYALKADEPGLVVNSSSDIVNPFDGAITLREAAGMAGTGDLGYVITFDKHAFPASGGAPPIVLNDYLAIEKMITIDGGGRVTLQNAGFLVSINIIGEPGLDRLTFSGLTFTGNRRIAVEFGGDSFANRHFVIDGCTFRDTAASGFETLLKFTGGTLDIRNSEFSNITTGAMTGAVGGGAISGDGTRLSISDTIFSNVRCSVNNYSGRGGAIYLDGGALRLDSVIFTQSGNVQDAGIAGGALYLLNCQDATILNCNVNSTLSANGGGFYFDNSKVTLRDVDFYANIAQTDGGAIYSRNSHVFYDGGSIREATAAEGGAIFMAEGGRLQLNNVMILRTGSQGATVGHEYGDNCTIEIMNSTISQNQVVTAAVEVTGTSKLHLVNSLIVGNYQGDNTSAKRDVLSRDGGLIYSYYCTFGDIRGTITGNWNVTNADATVVFNASWSKNSSTGRWELSSYFDTIPDANGDRAGTRTGIGGDGNFYFRSNSAWLGIEGDPAAASVTVNEVTADRLSDGRNPNSPVRGSRNADGGQIVCWVGSADYTAAGNTYYTTIKDAVNANSTGSVTIYLIDGDIAFDENATVTVSNDITLIGQDNSRIFSTDTLTVLDVFCRAFVVNNGAALSLVNITVDGFNMNGDGGAIYNQGNLRIVDSVISNSKANWGGAIYSTETGTVSIDHSRFLNNAAGNDGGAILTKSGLTVTGSSFEGNSSVGSGGAIIAWGGIVTIKGSDFVGNSASNNGGAIQLYQGTVEVADSIFHANRAKNGGAIAVDATGQLTVGESTFHDNAATEYGGALHNNGTATVYNSTFTANQAVIGGGAVGDFNSMHILNSVLVGNYLNNAPSQADDVHGNAQMAYSVYGVGSQNSGVANTQSTVEDVFAANWAQDAAGWYLATATGRLYDAGEPAPISREGAAAFGGTLVGKNGGHYYYLHQGEWRSFADPAPLPDVSVKFTVAQNGQSRTVDSRVYNAGAYALTLATVDLTTVTVAWDRLISNPFSEQVTFRRAVEAANRGGGLAHIFFADDVTEITLDGDIVLEGYQALRPGHRLTVTGAAPNTAFHVGEWLYTEDDFVFNNIRLTGGSNGVYGGEIEFTGGTQFNNSTVDHVATVTYADHNLQYVAGGAYGTLILASPATGNPYAAAKILSGNIEVQTLKLEGHNADTYVDLNGSGYSVTGFTLSRAGTAADIRYAYFRNCVFGDGSGSLHVDGTNAAANSNVTVHLTDHHAPGHSITYGEDLSGYRGGPVTNVFGEVIDGEVGFVNSTQKLSVSQSGSEHELVFNDPNGNYLFDGVKAAVTVSAKEITVTAADGAMVYGDTPNLSYQVDGLLGNDSITAGSLKVDGNGAGVWDIVEDTAFSAGDNYSVKFVKGTMTVAKRQITVQVDDQTKVYGDDDPELTWRIIGNGPVAGDTLNLALSYLGFGAGEYEINAALQLDSLNPNYEITLNSGTMTVTRRAVTVSVDDQTKAYGDADPQLTYRLEEGTLAGLDSLTLKYDGVNVGRYEITVEDTETSRNYSVTYAAKGTMTITRRELTVTADDQSKTYGDADPQLTWKITGGTLVGNDALTGSLKYDGVDAGTYDIVEDQSFKVNDNYSVSFVKGVMTVSRRGITITADDQSKTYGDADPTLTWSINSGSLVGDDTLGGELKYAGVDAGSYDIVFDDSTVNGNYNVMYYKGTMTINRREIALIGADVADKRYDGTTAATVNGGYRFDNLVNGESLGLDGVSAIFADSHVKGDESAMDVILEGGYRLVDGGNGRASNYVLAHNRAVTLRDAAKITRADVKVSLNDLAVKIYDGNTTATANGGAVSGMIATETLAFAAVNGTYNSRNVADASFAEFMITLSDGSGRVSDYRLVDADGNPVSTVRANGTISAKEITVSGIAVETRTYNGAGDISATLNYAGVNFGGMIRGDNLTVSAAGAFADGNAGTGKEVRLAALTLGGADAGNYVLAANGRQSVAYGTITTKEITVSGIVANDRGYNGAGDTSASLDFSGAGFEGLVDGDSLSVTGNGAFRDGNAGIGKTVDLTLFLDGFSAGNYVLAANGHATATASIIPKNIGYTISGDYTKVYDGTAVAGVDDISVLLNFSDLITGDSVNLNAEFAYNSKNVADADRFVATRWEIDNGNYNLADFAGQTASITPLALSHNVSVEASKVYDGDASAAHTGDLTNVIAGDEVALDAMFVYNSKNVAEADLISATRWSISGADAGNYTLAGFTPLAASITPLALSHNVSVEASKVYDGDASAAHTGDLTNVIAGDEVALDAMFVYNSKNVAEADLISATRWSISGADAGNYTLADFSPLSGRITALVVDAVWNSMEPYYFNNRDQGSAITADYTDIDGRSVGLTVSFGGKVFLQPGDYTATASVSDSNYAVSANTASRSFTIFQSGGWANEDNFSEGLNRNFSATVPASEGADYRTAYPELVSMESREGASFNGQPQAPRRNVDALEQRFMTRDNPTPFFSRAPAGKTDRLVNAGGFARGREIFVEQSPGDGSGTLTVSEKRETGSGEEFHFLHEPAKIPRSFFVDDDTAGAELLPPEYDIAIAEMDSLKKSDMFKSDFEKLLDEILVTA